MGNLPKNTLIMTRDKLEVDKMLLGIELGKKDEQLLSYVHFFSQQLEVDDLICLHVIEESTVMDLLAKLEQQNIPLREKITAQMASRIQQFWKDEKDLKVVYDIREGHPLEELLVEAEQERCDLIVTGQDSEKDFHGILAKNLARKAPCDTLIVPSSAKEQLKKILVPVDFSAYSVKALQHAMKLAKGNDDVKIVVLHVHQLPYVASYEMGPNLYAYANELRETAAKQLEQFVTDHAAKAKDKIEMVLDDTIAWGVGAQTVIYANENDVDLIVMGAKGHTSLDVLLLGSVTEKVLSLNKDVPVWVVR